MEKIILTIPAYDPEGRRIPDGAVHYWNDTTPASVENEKLKMKIKSFEAYAAQVKAKRLAEQMLVNNLLTQLAEAKAAPVAPSNDVLELKNMLSTIVDNTDGIKSKTENIHRIFNTPPPAPVKRKKKLSPKQILAQKIEERKREIEIKATQKILSKIS